MRSLAASLLILSLAPSATALADDRPSKKKSEESLDDLMKAAPPATAGDDDRPPPATASGASKGAAARPTPSPSTPPDDGSAAAARARVDGTAPASRGKGEPAHATAPGEAAPAARSAATAAGHAQGAARAPGAPSAAAASTRAKPAAAPAEPQPITDDNDGTAAAAPPTALQPVAPSARPRVPGPYELTQVDCRVVDGAGIERVMPPTITAGEEPDLLCRVMVTQPATVAAAQHTVTASVSVAGKVTWQQVRNVRMSAVGRRALIFVIPADRISSDETAKAVIRVVLSAPARPASKEVKFAVEQAD